MEHRSDGTNKYVYDIDARGGPGGNREIRARPPIPPCRHLVQIGGRVMEATPGQRALFTRHAWKHRHPGRGERLRSIRQSQVLNSGESVGHGCHVTAPSPVHVYLQLRTVMAQARVEVPIADALRVAMRSEE